VDPGVTGALHYLIQCADHRFNPVAAMHYRVVAHPLGYLVLEEGDELAIVADADEVVDLVFRRVHQRAFEVAALRGWVRIHAAVVDGPCGRVLVAAPSGNGKTTLSCRLLLDGVAVASDESALLRNGIALPVARRFHLKAGAEEAVAGLRPLLGALPAQGEVRAFDPSEAGYAWCIEARAVDHVVLLSRADGPASLLPASAVEVMPEVVSEAFRHQESVGTLLREIALLMRMARCWRLVAGQVSDAATLVRGLVDR
jgi:hypothetical protein